MNPRDFEKLVSGLENTLALANRKPAKAKKSTYAYRECGVDGIVLVNGYRRVKTSYGAGISIVDIDGLHKTIARALKQKTATTRRSRALRFKRDHGAWKLAA